MPLPTVPAAAAGPFGPAVSRARGTGHEGLQIGPVDRSVGRRAAPSLGQQAARVGPKPDIDSSELPSVGQPEEIDVGGTDDLHALDVHQLAVEHIPGQRDVALVPHGRRDQHLGVARSRTLRCSRITSDALTRASPLLTLTSTPETRG